MFSEATPTRICFAKNKTETYFLSIVFTYILFMVFRYNWEVMLLTALTQLDFSMSQVDPRKDTSFDYSFQILPVSMPHGFWELQSIKRILCILWLNRHHCLGERSYTEMTLISCPCLWLNFKRTSDPPFVTLPCFFCNLIHLFPYNRKSTNRRQNHCFLPAKLWARNLEFWNANSYRNIWFI